MGDEVIGAGLGTKPQCRLEGSRPILLAHEGHQSFFHDVVDENAHGHGHPSARIEGLQAPNALSERTEGALGEAFKCCGAGAVLPLEPCGAEPRCTVEVGRFRQQQLIRGAGLGGVGSGLVPR